MEVSPRILPEHLEVPSVLFPNHEISAEKASAAASKPYLSARLLPLANLSIDHAYEASENLTRRYDDVKATLPVAVAKENGSAKGLFGSHPASKARRDQLTPQEAAQVASVTAGAKVSRRLRGKQLRGPLPDQKALAAGWSDLLGEIAASSRRMRAARGGKISETVDALGLMKDVPGVRIEEISDKEEPINAAPEDTNDRSSKLQFNDNVETIYRGDQPSDQAAILGVSYQVDEKQVPDSILECFWKLAVDPRHPGKVKPLEKVPRLTVTTREVRQLPAVHDFSYWQEANKKNREQRKHRRESERNPTLEDMLFTMFGDPQVNDISVAEARLRYQGAVEMKRAAQEQLSSPELMNQVSSLQKASLQEELELLNEVEELLASEVTLVESIAAGQLVDLAVGSLHRGRRGGFDEGRVAVKASATGMELQGLQRKDVRSARLLKGLEAARAAPSLDEEEAKSKFNEVLKATKSVQEKGELRVKRMHDNFLRRRALLSERLQRWVKRIQIDHTEIHDSKVRSILPSVVRDHNKTDTPRSGNKERQYISALNYLKPHRSFVEKGRKGRDAIYRRQVELFEHYLRQLADPNRQPERGEVYLSQCFRHVLAAGLAVDRTFFFRVLRNLESFDFEDVSTVNLIAACCNAFSISLSWYKDFLEENTLPCFTPVAVNIPAKTWDDGHPWNGVTLVPMTSSYSPCEGFKESQLFVPQFPPSTPRTSEFASRDDPLRDVLEAETLDSVLISYNLERKRPPVPKLQVAKAMAIAASLAEEEQVLESRESGRESSLSEDRKKGTVPEERKKELVMKFMLCTAEAVDSKGRGSPNLKHFVSRRDELLEQSKKPSSSGSSKWDPEVQVASTPSSVQTARLSRPPIHTPPMNRQRESTGRVITPRSGDSTKVLMRGGYSTLAAVRGFAEPTSDLAKGLGYDTRRSPSINFPAVVLEE